MVLGLSTGVPLVDFLVTTVALLWIVLYFINKKDPRYPPGPTAIPILGNILQLGTEPQKAFFKLAQKYGSVFSIKIGSDDVIILTDHKIIKEVFAENAASGRSPHPVFMELGGGGNYGIIMSEGQHWQQQRRFNLKKLRDFGFAKSAMESMIMEEVSSFIHWVEKNQNTPITGNHLFNGAVVNSLWRIMSGERSEWDAPVPPKILQHAEGVAKSINRMTETGMYFVPFLRHIIPDITGWTAWVTHLKGMNEIATASIARHQTNLDVNNPQDLIDHFLIEKHQTTDPTSSFYKHVGDKNLAVLIPDLFLAGSETTSHTLAWALLYLAHNPHVQEKLQKELDTVVGRSRQASLNDRSSLPYTEATMMELLRKPGLVTNGVPHRMLQDAVIQGYLFPKNTTVISNIYLVHNDPKTWVDPHNFRPERFLSADGTKVVKNDALIPFSIGKRQCLGMSLAQDSLYLFLTSMFQRFTVKPDPKSDGSEIREDNIVPKGKMLNEPPPFKVVFCPRD